MVNSKNIKLTLEESKRISLDILKDVTEYCENNSITYFLACGTLLGAIKYKGFIPWDDDIDIMMPRDDFNKFINNYKHSRYKVLKPEDGLFCIGKVYDSNTLKYEKGIDYKKNRPLGVDIDIFPLDGMINDIKVIEKTYREECFLEMLLRLSNQPIFLRKNPFKCINRIIPRLIGSKNIVKWIIKNQTRYSYKDSDYVVRMKRSLNGFTGALPKTIFDKDYEEFEGITFCIPKGYDEWLKAFYGNYMNTLPPEEKRVPSHDNECYLIKQ